MNLEVTLAGKTFKNPVTTASGTFGSGAAAAGTDRDRRVQRAGR